MATMVSFRFKQGEKVKDKITGYTGKVTARLECLNLCLRYEVTAKGLKDGRPIEAIWIDETQLDSLGRKSKANTRRTGGPHNAPPSRTSNPT